MHAVIIGNGITGITAARSLRKKSPSCRITVISSESQHFYSRTALMYIYMGHMKYEHTKPYEDFFWQKNRIDLVFDHVERIDFGKKNIRLKSDREISYDKLLLATGSNPRSLNCPGIDLKGVQSLYGLRDLELLEQNTHPPKTPLEKMRVRETVIVGGGLIGIELAEMLISRGMKVTFLIKELRFWGNVLPQQESDLVMRHLRMHGVKIHLKTQLSEIIGDDQDRVKGVITDKGENIPCQFVGLTIGVTPNLEIVKNTELRTNRGILVNQSMETNLPDVYAAGDCAELSDPSAGRKPVEQVWYTGRMMGEVAGLNMAGERNVYAPGPWFNSAKFFDIEYQTYGHVPEDPVAEHRSFFWENSSGNKFLRIVYCNSDQKLIGLNVLGIRLRHGVIDRWLRSGRDLVYALSHLRDAIFDAEFSGDIVSEIVIKYKQESGKELKPVKKNWSNILLR